MQAAFTDPLASTQKPGEGDAFIFDPISNKSGLDSLMAYTMQTQKAKAAAKLKATENKQKAGQHIQDQLLKISDKIYFGDKDYFVGRVKEITTKLAQHIANGSNPFDVNDPAFSELTEEMMKLDFEANASKSNETAINASIGKFAADPKKFKPEFQQDLSKYLSTPFNQRVNSQVPVPQEAAVNLGTYLSKNFTPKLQAKYKDQGGVYNDETIVANRNKEIEQMKIQDIAQVYDAINSSDNWDQKFATPDEKYKKAEEYVNSFVKQAQYDPHKDETQDLNVKKQDDLQDYRQRYLDLQERKLALTEKVYDMNASKNNYTGDKLDPNGVITWANDLLNEEPAAIQRLSTLPIPSTTLDMNNKNVDAIPQKVEILKGDPKVKNQYGKPQDPNIKYIRITYDKDIAKEGNDLWLSLDNTNLSAETLINSPIGNAYKNRVTTKKDNPYTNPEYAAQKTKSSTTTTTKNVKYTIVSNKKQFDALAPGTKYKKPGDSKIYQKAQ